MDKLSSPIFFQLSKFDAIEGTFEAVATAELPDKTGEVCHYESTKPYYQKWSDGIKKGSGGKSLGNIRAMHQPIAAGKVTALDFDDAKKQIRITGKIVDKAEKEKMAEGLYTGVSQGGAYVEKWKEGDLTYYTADPSEISIVDNPCLGEAAFEYVKADGETEMRKFHVKRNDAQPEKENEESQLEKSTSEAPVQQGWLAKDGSFYKTKAEAIKHNQMVEAQEIAKEATAGIAKVMGDIENKLDEDLYWKREFSDEERKKAAESGEAMEDGSFPIKSEQDLKNAIRAVGRAKDPAKAKAHIKARAKALGHESLIPEDWKVRKRYLKGLFDVARAAQILVDLDWLHQSLEVESALEGDESPAPGHLSEIIKELCECLTSMVEEECGEIVEEHGGTGIEDALEAAAKLPRRQATAVAKFLKAGKLASAVAKAAAEEEDEDEHHPDRVHAIHKAAGKVMEHCMKAMHEMHDEDEEDAEKLLKSIKEAGDHMKKAHKQGHEIMQHCMKMGSAMEEGEDEGTEKFQKLQAVNDALTKTISDMTPKIGDLLKRIDHLERQPAVRKGAVFDVTSSHEAESGSPPVETAISNPYQALRLSPEAERRLRFGN